MADELVNVDTEGDLLEDDTSISAAEDEGDNSSDSVEEEAVEDSSSVVDEEVIESPSNLIEEDLEEQSESLLPDEDIAAEDSQDDSADEDPPEEEPSGTSIGVELTEEELAALDAEIAAQLDAEAEQGDSGDEWYFVHTYSGMENKVKKNLEHRTESMGMADLILQVVVPTETEVEIRKGVRKEVEKRVFPGYILVNMVVDEDSWYVVRNTPGVTGFVGMGNKPTPLSPDEVSRIMERLDADEPRVKVSFQLGEQVRITGGPFAEFNGIVEEIYADKGKAKVMVSFFNRETPVEVDFVQLEREE